MKGEYLGAVGGGMISGASVEPSWLWGEKVMADRATGTELADSAPHRQNGGAGEVSSASETAPSAERGAATTEGANASALLGEAVQDAADGPKAVPEEASADQPAARPSARRAPVRGKKKIRRGVAVPALLEAAFSVGRNVPMRAAGGRVCQQVSRPWP